MRKIINWLSKSKVDLSKKWWHRFFKVLFFIAIVMFSIYVIKFLVNSYATVTHRWIYVDSISSRLDELSNSNKVYSITELYKDSEVISEESPSKLGWGIKNKRNILPLSPLFLEGNQSETFCSDEIYKYVSNIASTNNIKYFSTTNPSLETLNTDINIFTAYLKNNSFDIKCVMLDSYTITNDNDTTTKFEFIRPVSTSDYHIYGYENKISNYILYSALTIVFLLLSILCLMLIYYKVILYIVYGKIEPGSSE